MMIKVLKADLLKMKRKWIWFLVFLGPLGIVGLQAVNFGLRYDYLVGQAEDVWQELLQNVNVLIPITLLLGIAILASMTANVEHQQNAWKQLLALPVSRTAVFTAKFIENVLLLLVACFLLVIETIILGIALRFGFDFPLLQVIKNSFYPLFAALPIMALQVWLSITMRNQALPLTIGIFGAIFSLYSVRGPDWLIWKWPLLISDKHQPEWFVMVGLAVGLLILLFGIFDFEKRDVK
ncbi:ABC transporter permease [Bacillus chungangensis]|uniref:Permease n=1 Tax=Bacillus chungangensis TaxID=587633 RepID=A0ABT9WPU5_9BACI|nr:ABC transporter permease [Bacillus chungangensis]MDQ0175315.1 hypothetical protein [Bacillus chungangensis]